MNLKLTKSFLVATLATAFGIGMAHADVINLATGLDASGNVQTSGDLLDANWSVTGGQTMKNGATAGQAFTVAPGNADWYGGWQSNGTGSSWITQNPDSNDNGLLTFTRTFNLTAGQLSGASFSTLGFSIDDSGEVLLNGHVEISGVTYPQAGALTNFSINSSDLVAGTNTLQMVIQTTDYNLEGARFEGTLTVQSVPAPSGLLFAPIGLAVLFLKKKVS